MIILNALPEKSYINGHIPGSISLPLENFTGTLNDSQINNIETTLRENTTEKILSQLNNKESIKVYNIPIIIYCRFHHVVFCIRIF